MSNDSGRLLANYHTHTWRCMHARGTEEEYVRRAIDAGISVLGFSDHSPWPYTSGFVSGMRMRWDQFPGYLDTVLALREKYAGQIKILTGLECEAFPAWFGWLRDLKAQCLDYVLMGNHYDSTDEGDHNLFSDRGGFYFGRCTRPEHVRRYVRRTIAGMETGIYDYLAHPDLFCNAYDRFDDDCAAASRDLCEVAAALNIPLEYNLLGVQYHAHVQESDKLGYPCPGFWEIAARYPVRAIIGFDAHAPEHLGRTDLYDAALAYLRGMGIEVLPCLDGPELS